MQLFGFFVRNISLFSESSGTQRGVFVQFTFDDFCVLKCYFADLRCGWF